MVLSGQICLNLDPLLLMEVVLEPVLNSLLDLEQLLLGEDRLEGVLDLLDVGEVPLLGHHKRVLIDREAALVVVFALGPLKVPEEALVESLASRLAHVLLLLVVRVILVRVAFAAPRLLLAELFSLDHLVLLELNFLLNLVFERLDSILGLGLEIVHGREVLEGVGFNGGLLLLLVEVEDEVELLLEGVDLLLHSLRLLLVRQVVNNFNDRVYVLSDQLGLFSLHVFDIFL